MNSMNRKLTDKLMRYYEIYADFQINTKWKTSAAAGMPFMLVFVALPYTAAAIIATTLRYTSVSEVDVYLLGLIFVALNLSYFVVCFLIKRATKKGEDKSLNSKVAKGVPHQQKTAPCGRGFASQA